MNGCDLGECSYVPSGIVKSARIFIRGNDVADSGFTRESDGAQRSYGFGPPGLCRLVGLSEESRR